MKEWENIHAHKGRFRVIRDSLCDVARDTRKRLFVRRASCDVSAAHSLGHSLSQMALVVQILFVCFPAQGWQRGAEARVTRNDKTTPKLKPPRRSERWRRARVTVISPERSGRP